MAKKKGKKAKAAKKSKPAKTKAKSKKKAPTKKAKTKKKATPKKAAKKKVAKKPVAKKKIAKKAPAKKTAVKKKATKPAPAKKVEAKKPVQKITKPVAKKPAAPKPQVHAKPGSHAKAETHNQKEEVKHENHSVQQQEAQGGEHKESFTPHITHLKEGDPAPYFSGIDQDGHRITLDDFKEKTLVLYFYPKDDTDGCTAESCSLRDEYSYITSQNNAVVGVSADDVESHKKFADKYSLPFPLIADTNMDIIRAYDVWGKKRLFDHIYDGIVRTTFIIKDGIITRVITSVNTKQHGKQVMEA